MSKKQTGKLTTIMPGKLTLNNNLTDHSKDPDVLRKARHTLKVLRKIGLPPSIRDTVDLDKIQDIIE